MATLLDAYGQPIKRELLDKPLAAPTLSGVRSIWNYSYITGGLTPVKLATLLRNATEGDADAQLTLAEEMEEKDPHYASVLGTRKRAVTRLPIVVEAASDKPDDLKMADEVRALFKRTGTKAMLESCLDALGKGYSAVEINWDKSRLPWIPDYTWRDPRFFQFDRDTLQELRLKDESDMMNGLRLPPYKFIVHTPRLKSGIPLRGGLARLAAWTYLFKNFTVKDWMAFCEVFGMPMRVGKYRPNETEDNIAILKSAVANLGSDAAAVIPEGMLIEFIETGKGSSGGNTLFERIANWFDKQLSKAVLGQTMTADDGSSRSQAQVHDEVRTDLRDADAEQLAETLMRDVVVPFINLNWGPRENYPHLALREPETADITILSDALAKLVPLGLRVEASEVRDKMGFSDPAKDAECLQPQGQPAVPTPPAKNTALNREQAGTLPVQDLDALLATITPDTMRADIGAILKPVLTGIQKGDSYEDALASLIEAYPQMDTDVIQQQLTRLIFVAEVWGRLHDQA